MCNQTNQEFKLQINELRQLTEQKDQTIEEKSNKLNEYKEHILKRDNKLKE